MHTAFNPLGVGDMAKDYIIDYGNNSNGWYRKWKSGWLEQGGLILNPSAIQTVSIINYRDTNYFINCQYIMDAASTGRYVSCGNKTINSFIVRTSASNLDNWSTSYPVSFYWETKGYI